DPPGEAPCRNPHQGSKQKWIHWRSICGRPPVELESRALGQGSREGEIIVWIVEFPGSSYHDSGSQRDTKQDHDPERVTNGPNQHHVSESARYGRALPRQWRRKRPAPMYNPPVRAG